MTYANAHGTNPAPGGLSFGARAELVPSSPLPDFNAVGGPAYGARLKGDAASDVMAILCNSGLPPRIDSINSMRSVEHHSILKLVDSGVVQWTQDDVRYFALAYQRPSSPRMMNTLDGPYTQMGEDSINHHFLAPMVGALSELLRTGTVHNAIRPTNIFWRPGGGSAPQIGDCLSAPAGVGQPALFEPLERALSMPIGRGMGSHVDDCYAFGVTLALLILGSNPLQGMDDAAVTQIKNERGTFHSLIGNRRLSAGHIEILRGLLTDDAHQRWTANDLELWLNGRRLTPKNTDVGRRSSRGLSFAGKEYWQVRPLALALSQNVSEASHLIESGGMDKWMRRALVDEERASALAEVQASLREGSKTSSHEEQVVARTIIALDPHGPIRYRGLSVMPGGVAPMLVEAMTTGNNLQALHEIISTHLISFWIEMQKEGKIELVPLGQQYERIRGMIERVGFGHGMERAIYELNPGLPCLSPIVKTQYVISPKTLLAAMERMASMPGRPREPMDRHIAAFLVVRERRSELLFDAMSSPETSPRRGLAQLTLYSEMQYKYGPDGLPGLAQWLMPLLEPSIQRYLGKTMKERIQAQVREAAARGDLGAMQRLLDDPKRIEYDRQEFTAARMLYLNTLKEIAGIEEKLANREIVMQETGRPMAASLSSFLAILMVLCAILRAVWENLVMG
ncbi:MAG TPA: serine/threonine-protein kinase [Alphaproteobacteria bacterium]|nr:serine/threonine-protein kinase [Alphaproteobacteria bacterium]